MLDTLLLRTSIHFTQLHLTPLHYTCWHFTSTHLNFTQLHFTALSFGLTPFKSPTAPFNLTSPHFTSLHCTFRWFSTHFYSFNFTPLIIAFLTVSKNLRFTRESLSSSCCYCLLLRNVQRHKEVKPTSSLFVIKLCLCLVVEINTLVTTRTHPRAILVRCSSHWTHTSLLKKHSCLGWPRPAPSSLFMTSPFWI
jgi:hypothetical protein